VRLATDGTPLLDYPLTPYVFGRAARDDRDGRVQFAAATSVMPVHDEGDGYATFGARARRRCLDLRPRATTIVSARDGRLRSGRIRTAPSSTRQVAIIISRTCMYWTLALPDVGRHQSPGVDLALTADSTSLAQHCVTPARLV
jgi:hypothetical protein